MCPLVVQNAEGEGSATAFHIGNGWMLTAAHVLDAATGAAIARSRGYALDEEIDLSKVTFHDLLDICIFRSAEYAEIDIEAERNSIGPRPEHYYGHIPLGGHYDDWIGDGMIMLSGIVIGYPPIPFSDSLVPVVHEFRVNAVIDRYDTRKPAFILSGVPRGGFSGGPAIAAGGWLLGVISDALIENRNNALDAPFLCSITIEPILEVIVKAGATVPGVNADGTLDFEHDGLI